MQLACLLSYCDVCVIVYWNLQIGPDMLMTGFLQAIPSCLPEVTAVGEAGAAFDASIASSPQRPKVIHFYKPWDPYGALSNFSPHPISLPNENETIVSWKSVEHYYQVILHCKDIQFRQWHVNVARFCY